MDLEDWNLKVDDDVKALVNVAGAKQDEKKEETDQKKAAVDGDEADGDAGEAEEAEAQDGVANTMKTFEAGDGDAEGDDDGDDGEDENWGADKGGDAAAAETYA